VPVASKGGPPKARAKTCRPERRTQPRTLRIERTFSPEHHQVLQCDRRFVVLVAGRRWGKTTLGLWRLVVHAASAPGRLCYYLAPTERQAKEIAWRTLKEIVSPAMRRCTRESDLEIELLNGSRIKLHGPNSLRGCGLDFVVLDEYADMCPTIWEEVVWPMLSDREGQALFIGTPKGLNHFYQLYLDAQSRPHWATFHFRTEQGGCISATELALLRSGMDRKRYAQELEASFEIQQGRIYHAFSRELNVTPLTMIPGVPVMVGMDFNVSLMTAVAAQRAGEQCHILAEILLPNSNTQEMMKELNHRYKCTGVVHPDPSGVARKTSAPVGQTDFTIIREAGWPVFETKPYPWIDRINTVNTMLCNAKDERRLFIDPTCKNLIRALDGFTYKEGTNIPDKASGYQHISDALGYLMMGAFSMIRHELKFGTVAL
jgi:hypothetical protein